MLIVNGRKVKRSDYVTKNFKYGEFASKCGDPVVKLDMKMVYKLQELRDWLDVPIVITSAYRSLKHNRRIGSSDTSQHRKGTAVDIQVKGYTPLQVAAYGQALGFKGIGVYNTFTHLDTRSYTARWGNTRGINDIKLKPKKKLSEVDLMSKEELRKLIQEEIQKALYKNREYKWADEHYNNLTKAGINIKEKRYGDFITRGAVFKLLDEMLNLNK